MKRYEAALKRIIDECHHGITLLGRANTQEVLDEILRDATQSLDEPDPTCPHADTFSRTIEVCIDCGLEDCR